MSYERAMYERLICDGCGVAVLETEDVLSHAPDWGWSVGDKHLCHMCQPDSPFEAVERVRELHHFVVDEIETREGPEDVQHCSECGYIPTDEEPCPTIRTLDGAA